jgi:phosphatidylinositol alpha-1,6-mannosyltransferase
VRSVSSPRTLLVTNDLMPQVGGIQVFNHEVLSRLPDAAVFAAAHPRSHEHDDTAPYPVLRGPHRYLFPVPPVVDALREAVAATGADVLLFATPWPVVSLGRRLGMPTAVVSHGNELVTPARVPGARQLLRRDLRRADLLYAVSDHTAGHLRRLVGGDGPPIRLLRNGVDVRRFHPDVDGTMVRRRHGLGDAPVVTCVGRLVRRKGQDVLVRAWPRVRAAVPDARLLVVGDGPLRDELAQAAAGQPPGAVTLTGRVPWDELPAHHAAADVFAHPNRTRLAGLDAEGFGVIFLEAQAVGRPVVAGASGGSPEALRPGETGLLVDGADVDAVADSVIALLTDPERRRAMGAAGRAFVEAHHDWDTIVGDLHEQLGALAAGHVPGR